MKFNFDEEIDRRNSKCIKYDAMSSFIGAENDAIPMWVADMDFKAAPCIIEALQAKLNHGVFGYGIKPDTFYLSIINWLKKRHGWNIEKDWISFSPGVVAGFTMAIEQFTQKGDKVMVQTPVYFPFFQSVTNTQRQLVNSPLVLKDGRLTIDFNDFEAQLKTGVKMFLLSNPHNPGGTVWTRAELEQISALCLKYNVLVVSDEIHADIVYTPAKHTPYASLSEEAALNSITVLSHSKTFNVAGLTTSYVIIPDKKLLNKYNAALSVPHLGMGNIFGTEALIAAYNNGEEWLSELLIYLKRNIDYLVKFTKEHLPLLEVIVPESTFLVWVDCRKTGWTPKEITEFFIKKAKVAINEGSTFGQGGEGFIRLNIGCTYNTVQKAMQQIKEAFEQC